MKDKKRKSMVSGPFDSTFRTVGDYDGRRNGCRSIDCDRPEILQEIRLNLTRLLQ